jgi:hypothetical protein
MLGCLDSSGLRVRGYSLAMAPSTASALSETYCYVEVPPNTDCLHAPGGNFARGSFNYNDVRHPGDGGLYVCQHTFIENTSYTVSRTCEPDDANTGCDLYYYFGQGYSFDGHAGNDSNVQLEVDGNVYTSNAQCT